MVLGSVYTCNGCGMHFFEEELRKHECLRVKGDLPILLILALFPIMIVVVPVVMLWIFVRNEKA